MENKIISVTLPNGTPALVRLADTDGWGEAAEKVGWKETFDFDRISDTLDGIAQTIKAGLEKAAPTKTTVELGIELAIKNGQLTGLIVNGQANASLKVTLEWDRQAPANDQHKG